MAIKVLLKDLVWIVSLGCGAEDRYLAAAPHAKMPCVPLTPVW